MNFHAGKRIGDSILKDFAKFVLGSQSVNYALRNLIIIRTWFLRTLRFTKNGFKNRSTSFPLKTYGDDRHQVFFGYYDIALSTLMTPLYWLFEPPFSMFLQKTVPLSKLDITILKIIMMSLRWFQGHPVGAGSKDAVCNGIL